MFSYNHRDCLITPVASKSENYKDDRPWMIDNASSDWCNLDRLNRPCSIRAIDQLLSHRETIEAIQTVPWCIMLSRTQHGLTTNKAGKTVEVKTEIQVSIQQVVKGLQK